MTNMMNNKNFMMDSKKVAVYAAAVSMLSVIVSLILNVSVIIVALISVIIIRLHLIIRNNLNTLRTQAEYDIAKIK